MVGPLEQEAAGTDSDNQVTKVRRFCFEDIDTSGEQLTAGSLTNFYPEVPTGLLQGYFRRRAELKLYLKCSDYFTVLSL